jgi:hypothetical protein
MAYRTASLARVTTFDAPAFSFDRFRRILSSSLSSVVTLAALLLIAAYALLLAALLASALLSAPAVVRASVPLALGVLAIPGPDAPSPVASVSGMRQASFNSDDPADLTFAVLAREADRSAPPGFAAFFFSQEPFGDRNSVALLSPPPDALPPSPIRKPAPALAMLAPPSHETAPVKPLRAPELPANDPRSILSADGHTAVYDIAAHAVYLPNGQKLEAHSGLGRKLDDPRFVNVRDAGPTPPNVYQLTLRGELFHGVRALRLTPVGGGNMFGRDGILAHTYMLGANGQSNGCVSFANYDAFLHAFLRGEVDRMVVVAGHTPEPSRIARSRHGDPDRYAF